MLLSFIRIWVVSYVNIEGSGGPAKDAPLNYGCNSIKKTVWILENP